MANLTLRTYAPNIAKNDDVISYVVEHIIHAHARWKSTTNMKLQSYLIQCARWAITRWKRNSVRSVVLETMVEDTMRSNHKPVGYWKDVENTFNNAITHKCLNKTQQNILQSYFVDNKSMRKIGKELGVSQQAVCKRIKGCIKLLKKNFHLTGEEVWL